MTREIQEKIEYMRYIIRFLLAVFTIFLISCSYNRGFLVPTFLPDSLSWIKISSYGLMMAGGFITGNYLLHIEFERLKIPVKLADNLIIAMVIGGIVGAKVFYVWETSADWSGLDGLADRLFSGGGLTWYGGFVGASLFCYFLARKERIPYLRLADIATPAIALGYMYGRLGCLFSGDGCYGEKCPYDWPAPFAMSFPNGAAPWSEIIAKYNDPLVKVYNTPLFEASFSFLLFLFFFSKRKKEWPMGIKLVCFVILHSIFRFSIEFIRLNPRDVFGLSQGQFVSIVLVFTGILFILYKRNEIKAYWEANHVSTGHQ